MDDVAQPPIAVNSPPDAPTAAKPAERRKARPFVLLAIFIAIAAAGFAGYVALHAGKENTDDAQVEGDVVAIAPRTSGRISHVLVHDNQKVREGDELIVLEDNELRARVAKAEAELAVARAEERTAEAQEHVVAAGAQGGLVSAQAHLSSSRVDVNSADTQIEIARAQLARAQADAQKAALELSRVSSLRASGAATAEQLDNAQIADTSARAAVAQAQASLSVSEGAKLSARSRVAEAAGRVTASAPVEAQLEAARAHTELTRAHVQASEAALTLAQLDLSYTHVRAPRAGTIAKLSAREGQLINVGQPIAELVPSETYLVANFKETQISRMRPGDPVEIELDAYPGRTFHGKIESLSGGTGARFSLLPADNASGNFVKVVQRVPVTIAWQTVPSVPVPVGLSADATVDVRGH
jgi:membrane fusion protein (multidrug efflux system)